MKKNLIGLVFILYGITVFISYFIGTLNNFLASKMIFLSISSGIVMLIIGVILILDKSIYMNIKKINILLIIPFIMIFFAGDGELSIALASKRASNLSSQMNIDSIDISLINQMNNDEFDYIITDENYNDLINYITNDTENSEGKTVKISGYAVVDAEYITDGYFAIGKYSISCCTADAGFVGILVENKDLEIEKNLWFEIEGVLEKTTSKYGYETLYLKILNIQEIEAQNRYV